MYEGFYEVKTDFARTSSGIILPNTEGKAMLVMGLQAPPNECESAAKQLGIEWGDLLRVQFLLALKHLSLQRLIRREN